jgi:YidC/Oxa1 family membrane protein insertase
MDRTAWIAVTLCVIGLVLWELYLAKQTPPRRAPVNVPARAPAVPTLTASPSAPPLATAPATALKPEEAAASFSEKIETLRNSDVELHLTNRGGGIKEAVLLKQVAEKGQRVILNSSECAPIGAIIEQPSAPLLPEFTASPESNSAVQFERTAPEQITTRKKFFFPPSTEKKDNFIIGLDVDLENRGPKPYQTAGYFVALGSAAPIHPKDYPSYAFVHRWWRKV